MGYANVRIEGELVDKPELRYFFSGVPCASFVVKVRKSNGHEKHTTYVNCKMAGDGAEDLASAYCRGDRVLVVGCLVSHQWRYYGEERSKLIVDVASVEKAA